MRFLTLMAACMNPATIGCSLRKAMNLYIIWHAGLLRKRWAYMKIPLHSIVNYQLKLMIPKYSLVINIFASEKYIFCTLCKLSVFY